MITNSYMTIYNSYYDKLSEKVIYKKTYLYGVNWQVTQMINIAEKGINAADKLTIYIPENITAENNKKYVKPSEYENLSDKEKDSFFTLKNGDKVCRGILEFNITGDKGYTLKDLEKQGNVFTIILISDNRYGSLSHWEVGGI